MQNSTVHGMASENEHTARTAWNEFYNQCYQDREVFEQAVSAVPGLAELAAMPGLHLRPQFPQTLGDLANPEISWGTAQPAARAAVQAQAGTLAPLLDDPHPDVRAATAYALSQCGPHMAEVLRARWDVEREPAVRANLLGALAELGQTDLLHTAAVEEPGPVSAAAGVAYVRKGWELPPETVTAIVASLAADDRDWSPWIKGSRTSYVMKRLSDKSADTLATALAGGTSAAKIRLAQAMSPRFIASRRAPALLMPHLRTLVNDPDHQVAGWATSLLTLAGEALAAIADDLLRLALNGDKSATSALLALGDPRWPSSPDVWKLEGPLSVNPPAYSPEGLDAVRRWIAETPQQREKTDVLAAVLERWGERAAPAVPELIAALPGARWTVSRALGAIGPAARAAVPDLLALDGVEPAHAVWQITGDPGPLVEAGAHVPLVKRVWRRPEISNHHELRQVADAGEAARPLLPRLLPLMTDDTVDAEIRLSVAEVAWRATGDAALVLPAVEAALTATDIGLDLGNAVDLAAQLAPAGASLVPLLWTALHEKWPVIKAARALLRHDADPAGLIGPLVAHATTKASREAVELLVELRATETVPVLAELAERDRRQTSVTADDEAVRHALRAAVAALS